MGADKGEILKIMVARAKELAEAIKGYDTEELDRMAKWATENLGEDAAMEILDSYERTRNLALNPPIKFTIPRSIIYDSYDGQLRGFEEIKVGMATEEIVEMLKRIVNERREKRRRLAEAIDRVLSDEENPHE